MECNWTLIFRLEGKHKATVGAVSDSLEPLRDIVVCSSHLTTYLPATPSAHVQRAVG